MSTFLKIIVCIMIILLASGFWVWHEAQSFMDTPASQKSENMFFDVQPGASLSQISRALEEKGLVSSARKFVWLARFKDCASKIQAGKFILNTGWNPVTILDALVTSKGILHKITIPEGLTWWQTARLLDDAGFARFNDFRDVIMDPVFLRHYGIPFNSAEGFLMPDTYLLKKTDMENVQEEEKDALWRAQARAVAGRMVDNFWRKADALWTGSNASGSARPSRPDSQNLRKWVTLASIVEKETAIDNERPRVAGVYANRMARNMLLQADPTVIYGLGPEFRGQLLRSALEDKNNPYNTYQKPGLPPGPISSFGISALKAAMNPEKHNYLYFVAITDGGAHAFSETLDQHNEAVREYRRQKRQSQ